MAKLALDEIRLRCALTDILEAEGKRVANDNLVIKGSVAENGTAHYVILSLAGVGPGVDAAVARATMLPKSIITGVWVLREREALAIVNYAARKIDGSGQPEHSGLRPSGHNGIGTPDRRVTADRRVTQRAGTDRRRGGADDPPVLSSSAK